MSLVSFTFLFLAAFASLDCTIQKAEIKKLVWKGHRAKIEDHPYQIYLTFDTVSLKTLCGGSIISEDFILTAAHCVIRPHNGTSTIEVQAGSIWANKGTIIPIAKSIVHPKYSHGRFNMDVALLKTESPIKFTNRIKPIRLPARDRPMVEGSRITVSGWGVTEAGYVSDRLMVVTIPVANFFRCLIHYYGGLTKNMWCGGYFDSKGKGACMGDSGGPAVQDGMVVGIVSFGKTNNRASTPSVYTNVAAPNIRDFILEHTGL